MNIVSVKFGLFQKFGHGLSGQILTQPDIVLDGAPATYKNCVLPSVVGMRLSIEREAKKFPSEISLFVTTARKQRKTQWGLLSLEIAFESGCLAGSPRNLRKLSGRFCTKFHLTTKSGRF